MESIRKVSRRYYLRQIVACFLTLYMSLGIPVQVAMADPNPTPDTVPGSANVVGNTVPLDWIGDGSLNPIIGTASGNNVITWNNFDIGSNGSLTFTQNGGWILNNVQAADGMATGINGGLFGPSCGLIVVNPLGLVFGPEALVQARNFIGSSLDILESDFANGVLSFTGDEMSGAVVNKGQILTEGMAALIGSSVYNSGLIRSQGGLVVMAAGEEVFLGQQGSDVVVRVGSVTVTDSSPEGIGDVINEGTIESPGGRVVLAAGDTFARAIDGLGELAVAAEGGTGRVAQLGTIDVDGVDGDGGSVTLTAAEVVALGDESVTTANAGENGDGGEVIVYSPDTALFREGAVIEAKGGSESGDGGFVEVSGREFVEVLGSVNAGATNGQAGTFLIDPTNIWIIDSGSSIPGVDGVFTPVGDSSIVTDDAIEDFLNNGTDVIINTASEGAGDGWIAQGPAARIEKTVDNGDVTLSLIADSYITLLGGIEGGADAGALNVDLNAGDAININNSITLNDGGNITMTALGDILIDGDITTTAYAASDAVTVVDISAGGNLTVADNIEVTAIGDGVGDAIATIELESTGGKVTILSDDADDLTIVRADAHDGANNSATVRITADGDAEILGPDQVEVAAEAYNATTLNEATVEIKGDNVKIEGNDDGTVDQVVEVIASAHDGETNISKVDIEATDGSVEIVGADEDTDNPVLIKAVSEYGSYNYADVIIKATDDVTVRANDQGVKIHAVARYGSESGSPALLNEANVNIEGENVTVIGEDPGYGDDDAVVKAEAQDGEDNLAKVTITATDDGEGGGGNVLVKSEGSSDDALIKAYASDGATNTAEVEITATDDVGDGGNVEVSAEDGGKAKIIAKAENGDDNSATVDIGADGDVIVEDTASSDSAEILAIAKDGIDNTAGITIDAGGDVKVLASEGGTAGMKAIAKNAENTNTANVTIGDEAAIGGSVIVSADNGGTAEITALAKNGSTNTANVNVSATDDVEVSADNGSIAEMEAMAKNAFGPTTNTAGVGIITGGDVLVLASNGSGASISAEAQQSVTNNASVGIDAGGKVRVVAETEDSFTGAMILAGAGNYIEINSEVEPAEIGDVQNTATIDIVADSVEVYAGNNSESSIEALAGNQIFNSSDSGAELVVDGSVINTATTTITATQDGEDVDGEGGMADDGEIMVKSEGDSWAYITAEAGNVIYNQSVGTVSVTVTDTVSNSADVILNATEDVKAQAYEGGDALIYACSRNYIYDETAKTVALTVGNDFTNTSNLMINAGESVKVKAGNGGFAEMYACAGNEIIGGSADVSVGTDVVSGDVINNSVVDIVAAEGVEVKAYGGEADIGAWSWNELGGYGPGYVTMDVTGTVQNLADVTIDAGDDVKVKARNGGEAYIAAESENYIEGNVEVSVVGAVTNTANVGITADGDVEVTAKYGGRAWVEAKAKEGLDNTATVSIDAIGGDVKVIGKEGGKAAIKAVAKDAESPETNTANVTINATEVEVLVSDGGTPEDPSDDVYEAEGGDVKVIAKDHGEAEIKAVAVDGITNDSDVQIGADGDVKVIAKDGGDAKIKAVAVEGTTNTANVGINAGDDVKVIAEGYGSGPQSEAAIEAKAITGGTNTSAVTIGAGEDVLVLAKEGGLASIAAKAIRGGINNANVNIDAGEDVKVIAKYGGDGKYSEARIKAVAVNSDIANNAGVLINAGDDVKAIAKGGGDAKIKAVAVGGTTNTANVGVNAGDDVKVIAKGYGSGPASEAAIQAKALDGLTNDADVFVDALGDVMVYAEGGRYDYERQGPSSYEPARASIEALAEAEESSENTANVKIDTHPDDSLDIAGEVRVEAQDGGEAGVLASAQGAVTNTAGVEIGNPDPAQRSGDVLVIAQGHGSPASEAYITALTAYGEDNTSNVQICSEGFVEVAGGGEFCEDWWGNAEISAIAKDAETSNSATTTVCAIDGVEVIGQNWGTASILAEASDSFCGPVSTDNDALVQVHSSGGGISVIAENSGDSEIKSLAKGGINNMADTIVCADGDIIVRAGNVSEPGCEATIVAEAEAAYSDGDTLTDASTLVVSDSGGVGVVGLNGGKAEITSIAKLGSSNTAYTGVGAGGNLDLSFLPGMMQDYFATEGLAPSILVEGFGGCFGKSSEAWISSFAIGYNATNNSDIIICTPGEIFVGGAFGGWGKVESWAHDFGPDADNSATTAVYAGNGVVGDDIVVDGSASISAFTMGSDGVQYHCLTEAGEVALTDGSAILATGSYAAGLATGGCPTCPPCPCEEQSEPEGEPAPIYTETGEPLEKPEFEEGGCPALMNWFASEAGIPADQIQVLLGGADYLATDIQPCEACARLKAQADAMGGVGADQINSWATTVRSALVGPPTPEMIAGIRTALADNPAALSFDDAAVEYVRILNGELGIPTEDALAMLTGNYAPDSADLGAYIGARSGI